MPYDEGKPSAPKPPKKGYKKVEPKKEGYIGKVKSYLQKYVKEPTGGAKLKRDFQYNPFKPIEKTTWFNKSNSTEKKEMTAYEKWKAKHNQATPGGG